jgi:hypothetical protein
MSLKCLLGRYIVCVRVEVVHINKIVEVVYYCAMENVR